MDDREFMSRVLQGLGMGVTEKRLEMMLAWHKREGMPLEQTWNPIATTWFFNGQPALNTSFDIGYGPGNWNSVPVRVYATPEDGIKATVWTLAQDYYPYIRQCLWDETGHDAAINEFVTYVGSRAYGEELVNTWKQIGQKGGEPVADIDMNTALMMRFDLINLASGDFETLLRVHRYLAQGGAVPSRG